MATESALTLWYFPPEVRELIFEFALAPAQNTGFHEDTAYETNGLLVALRGERVLYFEALPIFYGLNTVHFTIDNYRDFRGKGRTSRLKRVRHLGVDLSYNFKEYRLEKSFYGYGRTIYSVINNFVRFFILHDPKTNSRNNTLREPLPFMAPQLETLHFDIFHDTFGYYNTLLILKELLPLAKNLRAVHLSLYRTKLWSEAKDEHPLEPWEVYHRMNLVVQIAHLFGMKGKSGVEKLDGPGEFTSSWCWEAAKGEVLKVMDPELEVVDLQCDLQCKKLREGPC